MLFERRVEEGERCRPACTRRSESVGVDVRSDKRCVRLDTVVLDGTVIGIVSPDRFLTNICIDSGWGSGEADLEEEGVDILGTVSVFRGTEFLRWIGLFVVTEEEESSLF